MQEFYIIDSRKKPIVREYLDHRPELKSVLEVSRGALGHSSYPSFVMIGIRLHDESKQPLLEDWMEAMDKGLDLMYGAEYQEFAMFCEADYKVHGSSFWEEHIKF